MTGRHYPAMLEIRGIDAHLTVPGTQIPRRVYRAAFEELCARIWIELEQLPTAADPVISAAILRLELVVLVDSCRSPRWRALFSVDRCDSLCSLLTDVLAALYADPEYLPMAIEIAQDRLLDELLPLNAWVPDTRSRPHRSPVRDLEHVQ